MSVETATALMPLHELPTEEIQGVPLAVELAAYVRGSNNKELTGQINELRARKDLVDTVYLDACQPQKETMPGLHVTGVNTATSLAEFSTPETKQSLCAVIAPGSYDAIAFGIVKVRMSDGSGGAGTERLAVVRMAQPSKTAQGEAGGYLVGFVDEGKTVVTGGRQGLSKQPDSRFVRTNDIKVSRKQFEVGVVWTGHNKRVTYVNSLGTSAGTHVFTAKPVDNESPVASAPDSLNIYPGTNWAVSEQEIQRALQEESAGRQEQFQIPEAVGAFAVGHQIAIGSDGAR